MKKTSLHFLKACSLSVALLGSVAVVAAVSMPDVAFAKSGNDNGGGNGGGNGNGGGKSDKSSGNGKADKADKKKSDGSASKATKTKTKTKEKVKAKAKAKPKKKDLAEELGVHPSELGALNAAHANANAFKNASPNSRVGRIAAYRDAVLAGEQLAEDLALAEAELAALPVPGRPSTEVKTELDLAAGETATAEGIVGDLEDALAAADPADTDLVASIEADLAAARDDLAAAEATEDALQEEYDAALAYEEAAADVADLTQKVEDQPELETSLLEAAANKEVTPEVEAAVKKLLGLDP